MVFILLFLSFINFSKSILVENQNIEDLSEEENNIENDDQDMPPPNEKQGEVYEAWLKKKLEVHQKIAELEARHHEEELDEDDEDYHRKIEKIVEEELDKEKFYQEYEQNKKKQEESLEKIQDEDEIENHNHDNNFLNNLQKFNDAAKSLHNEIIKESTDKNSPENKKINQETIQKENVKQNNKETSQIANNNIKEPTITITSNQEISKPFGNEQINETENVSPFKKIYLLIPVAVLTVIGFILKIFNRPIKRWINHKRSDDLPNSLKYS
ncbi:hypothetical protein M9Y10_019067 [Tritrichomonas musculus]|uniref:Uncharacterized protein n=1 Tax=Tritrichomonas musculus TaxID=1915356 RepID=A0ABR2HIG2_9EUKA